ncbi:MAG: C45 family autoproteolytic acyltransferase/hydrolase, partial [Pseudomonadota bacterium]
DVFTATSGEFQAGVKALSDGYRAGHPEARYDLRDVIQACVAIDVGNVAAGFARRASRLLGEDGSPVAIIKELKAALRHYASVNPDDLDRTPPRTVLGLLMRAIGRSPGMGCTGFSVAPALCGGTHGLHARTFDGAFFDWNNVPGLHLVDERDPARPAIRHRYAAVGTAGLVYPGGISGINEAGLAFSLHQMSTVSYTRGTPGGGWEIAPFVMQRMLRECTTLGEAIALAESVCHFASWTILASDARNGQSVRIEINGHGGARAPKPEVSAIDIAPWLAQSNHFLAASMRERFDFFGDAHFTKTPGKWLETRARKRTVEQELTPILANGSLDMTKALALLASHDDAALDGAFRSFGRTIVKAYGIMASIARAPAAGGTAELWFTLGDRLPGPHSAMVGFAVDWEHFALSPLAGGTLRAATPPDQLDALSAYIDAHRAQLRPRGEDGRYLGREPTAAEEKAIAATVLGHLDRAIEKAENTHGEVEAPMRYIRARVAFEADDLTRARRDIERLRALATGNVSRHTLIAYERALILTLCAALEKAEGHDDKAKADAT